METIEFLLGALCGLFFVLIIFLYFNNLSMIKTVKILKNRDRLQVEKIESLHREIKDKNNENESLKEGILKITRKRDKKGRYIK